MICSRNKISLLKIAILLTSLGAGVSCFSLSADASGFALIEQSVKGLGNAFSSGATDAQDASAIFFNPAGLVLFEGNSAVGATYFIAPTARFENEGSALINGIPLRGGNGGDAAPDKLVPNFYAAWKVGDRIKLGVGVNAPFALATDYQPDWVGRYQALKSELVTININPTIAAKLSDNFAVGAGINVQYAAAELTNAIDFGAIAARSGSPVQPQSLDGKVELWGEDWSIGYNIGMMYTPSKATRIGLHYRSGIKQELEGRAKFTVPTQAAVLTRRGAFTNTNVSAELNIPDTVSLSAYQKVSPSVALTGDVTWTNWSKFKELRVDFENPAQPPSIQPENWKNTVRTAIGVNYDVNRSLTLRAGVAYDPSPVKDEFRTARIPDGDRTWVSLGASYRPNENVSLDVGYAHLFVKDRSIDQIGTTGDRVRGSYSGGVNIIGVQGTWRF